MYKWRSNCARGHTRNIIDTFEHVCLADHQQTHCNRMNTSSNQNNFRNVKQRLYAPIRPKSPKMLPNTSTMRILTNKFGSAASASAAVEPVMPTQMPQRRLHTPTVRPPQKSANPDRTFSSIPIEKYMEWGVHTCEVVLRRVYTGIHDSCHF